MNEDDKQACRMIVKMAENYNECSDSFAHYDQEAKLRLAIVDEQDKKLKQF